MTDSKYIQKLQRNKQRRITRKELANFINNFAWEFFVTATYSIDLTPATGRKLWLGYLDKLEKRFQLPIPRIWFQEFSQRGDTPHYHALIGRIGHIKNSAKIMWELWYEKLNYGAMQTLPYDPARGANEYLTKYVGKNQFNSGDWGLDILSKL